MNIEKHTNKRTGTFNYFGAKFRWVRYFFGRIY